MLQNFDYLNWPAVAVAALAYFGLGALWYSKALFAKRWIADLKIDVNAPDAKKGMGMMFGGSLVMMFVQSLAIAIIAERLGIRGAGWMSGLKLGSPDRLLLLRCHRGGQLPVREKADEPVPDQCRVCDRWEYHSGSYYL
ncbi:MAG: DUF1761 domain-containing protein [Chitinophagaceae bacterium]|nr:DUF1761 domain-containing protein [Chitinophagaceae bacterium]